MNQVRTSRGSGSAVPVEDPERIRRILEELRLAGTEFPIKVEGTHTLPYTARIEALEGGALHLKLIRPLPHELAAGAPFEMLFATADQRFRGLMTFHGRQGYLLYGFTIPPQLVPSDQRQHKRYPFRPREKAYVLAQDGAVPGHGLSGPLVNLSLGGLAFRVDRLIRLDDHMPLSPNLGFFEKGKILPMLKLRDLPKLPLLEIRGKVANACERGGEIIVGVQFGELNPAEHAQIQEVLEFRERMMHAPASVLSGLSGTPPPGGAASPSGGTGPRAQASGSENPLALRLLGRRATDILLAMPPGESREQTCRALAGAGYLRVEAVDSLPQALAILRAGRTGPSRFLMAAGDRLQAGDLEEVQALQRDFGDLSELPVALLGAPAGTLDGTQTLLRSLPFPFGTEPGWLDALDDIAGVV